jgi:hypothetical protein
MVDTEGHAARVISSECKRHRANLKRNARRAVTRAEQEADYQLFLLDRAAREETRQKPHTPREIGGRAPRLNTDPEHRPCRHCAICAGLAHRRLGPLCFGCGMPAGEEGTACLVVLSSSSGLALTG